MAHRDYRAFLAALESKGELSRIKKEVDWNQEVGAIFQENIFRRGPALVYENVKDYKDKHGRKLATQTDATIKRCAIALDVNENSSKRDLINLWRTRSKQLIKPVLVSSGPCKEVVHRGKDVSLLEFPVPRLHPFDGGRYILTWDVVVTKDPETGWVNCGTYRGMVLDETSIGVDYHHPAHWVVHGAKYKAMGKPMPLAAAIGVDPVLMYASTSAQPFGICEYDIAGGIRKEPLALVKCETVDLEIPAGAEIVIEGEMSLEPSTFRPEGPFGEFTGHYSGLGAEPKPVFKVKCITHRTDPFLAFTSAGMDPAQSPELAGNWGSSAYMSFVSPALILDSFQQAGLSGVIDVASPGPAGSLTIISTRQPYYGYAKQVAAAFWGGVGRNNKFIIVVDDDIDVQDTSKVFLALGNRAQGGKSISIYKNTAGLTLDPACHPDVKRKLGWVSHNDRVLIDATWPFEWEPREEWGGLKHPPPCRADLKMIEKVRKNWKDYGLP